MQNFLRNPLQDDKTLQTNFLSKKRGSFYYFRSMCMRMQERFADLMEHEPMPQVFLHGNPHIENYVITQQGAAMVDFDRARLGPYAWDLVRFLSSAILKSKLKTKKLPRLVGEYFLEGYRRSFLMPKVAFKGVGFRASAKDTVWFESTNQYLANGGKWARQMRANPLKLDHPYLQSALQAYIQKSQDLDLQEASFVEEAGQALGTFGNRRFLVVLAPKEANSADRVFLDLKTVYQDEDNQWYKNPFDHHGERMVYASHLYAPRIEQRLAHFTSVGQQYWGRQIPFATAKVKRKLNTWKQIDLAFSVGTQLGQGHRKSIVEAEPTELYRHLMTHYKLIVEAAHILSDEIVQAHQLYIKQLAQPSKLQVAS